MTLTDEDLKRLKEHADSMRKPWVIHYKTGDGISRQFDIKALLSRLEAVTIQSGGL